MLSIFPCAYWPSVCLLWRNAYLDTLSFFSFLFSCLGCFFDIKLYELFVYSGNYSIVGSIIFKCFLPFCKLSFHFVYGFLFCAKAFKFNQVPFVYFCFYFLYFRRQIQKILLRFMSNNILPMLFSRRFMLSNLSFVSLIHFEFIFVYGIEECANFILLYVAIQFSQYNLLKRLSFLHYIFLPFLSQIIDYKYMGLCLNSPEFSFYFAFLG